MVGCLGQWDLLLWRSKAVKSRVDIRCILWIELREFLELY